MDDSTSISEQAASAIPQGELDALTDQLIEKLKTVYDPEIPVDIYELGLIYKVDVSDDKAVVIDMTLTAPGCPVAGEMPDWVRDAVVSIPEVRWYSGCPGHLLSALRNRLMSSSVTDGAPSRS